jgi:hypothetical protein
MTSEIRKEERVPDQRGSAYVLQTVAGSVRFAHFDDRGSLARAATATLNVRRDAFDPFLTISIG